MIQEFFGFIMHLILLLLKTISYARTISLQQSTWKILKYKPNLEHLMYALDGFEKLICFKKFTFQLTFDIIHNILRNKKRR